MEPFGFFQLLRSMLNTPPTEGAPTAEKEPPSEGQRQPLPPTKEQEKPNACAAFFEAHERRARRK